MKRRLRQILTVLSLLLCLATAGLWVRSGWRTDLLTYRRTARSALDGSLSCQRWSYLISLPSHLQIRIASRNYSGFGTDDFDAGDSGDGFYYRSFEPARQYLLQGVLGFGAESGIDTWSRAWDPSARWRQTFRTVQFPHWFLVLLLAIPPAMSAAGWLRRQRLARKLGEDSRPCPACGYDLRATPTHCPECGTLPE